MIVLRLKLADRMLGPIGQLERRLEAAGVPPYAHRKGGMMHWWDAQTDEFVYEYYEPEEMRLPQANPRSESTDGA